MEHRVQRVGNEVHDRLLHLAPVQAEQRQRLILPHHALHAHEVRFTWRGQQRVFRAEPELWFMKWLEAVDREVEGDKPLGRWAAL